MKATRVVERSGFLLEEVVSDRLSSKLKSIKGKIAKSNSFNDLVAKGEAICENITYLNENLRLLEKNDLGQSLLLRSVEPDQVKQQIEYFELLLEQSGELNLRRFSYSKDSHERVESDFVLSHELIDRLVEDLAQLQ